MLKLRCDVMVDRIETSHVVNKNMCLNEYKSAGANDTYSYSWKTVCAHNTSKLSTCSTLVHWCAHNTSKLSTCITLDHWCAHNTSKLSTCSTLDHWCAHNSMFGITWGEWGGNSQIVHPLLMMKRNNPSSKMVFHPYLSETFSGILLFPVKT